MRTAGWVVAGGIFKRLELAVRASVGTATVFGAMVAVALSVSHGHSAFAQSKGAQTAAGAMIIQNNQMRQELRETRKELKEIKEGLGIESAPSANSDDRPSLLFVILSILAAGAIAIGLAVGLYRRWITDLKEFREELEQAKGKSNFWKVVRVLCSAQGIPAQVLILVLTAKFLTYSMSYSEGRRRVQESVEANFDHPHFWNARQAVEAALAAYDEKYFFDATIWFCGVPALWFTAVLLYARWRFFSTSARTSKAHSAQSESDASSHQAVTKSLDSGRLTQAAGAVQDRRLWVRTPTGKVGGPYRADQIAKAVAAGKVPGGSMAASSPDGPWQKIIVSRG
jgi:hypothetical protein